MNSSVRAIAFYLPQFHPIPENDLWWGKGFTEWTNVTRAKPLFRGHYQPRLPGELGFYDLRVPEVREQQAALARQYGIEGFCYWHYWFLGRRLLERPFQEVLQSGSPDLPFCLAWANHSWDRSWLSLTNDLLIRQEYSPEDDLNHIRWLATAFADPRYIRIQGRPIFLVYWPTQFPDPRRTTDTWRQECVRLGLPEPYLIGMDARAAGVDMRSLGFDATEHHAPKLSALPNAIGDGWTWSDVRRNLGFGLLSRRRKLYRFDDALRRMRTWSTPVHPYFPCLPVGWDSTARRGARGIVLHDAEPEMVAGELRRLIDVVAARPFDERLVFLNAWNEWAEGMYLEPDARHGRRLLEAVGAALLDDERR